MKKKNLITSIVLFVCIAIIVILIIRFNKPTPAIVAADGSVSGNYAISNILALQKSYECSFTKSDEAASVQGTLQTDGSKVRGDFDISLQVGGGQTNSFASHTITKDNTTYAWTSLQPIGYKTRVVKSATRGATPEEQAQILGQNDKVQMSCKPTTIDQSVFNVPEAISFTQI